MTRTRLLSIIFFFYTIILSIGSIKCRENNNNNNNLVTNQTALFVFGDSLFDVGNNLYIDTLTRANFWPYGRTTFRFPTGRVSDGRLITDFIAEYAWLPLIPPNLQPGNSNSQFTYGANFASGGAGALVESFAGTVIDLGTQLNSFKDVERRLRSDLGDAETKKIFTRAVYMINIGSNDYFYQLFQNSSILQSTSKETLVDFVIGNTTSLVKEVYKMGGRKFGFLTLGPYDCVPGAVILDTENIGACYKPITELFDLHNKKFPDALRRLQRELSGFRYALHEYRTSLSERINNPTKFGFKEGKKACCGSGPLRGNNTCGNRIGTPRDYELCENVTEYLFFDGSHLTEKAHRQIAELIWSGPPNVTGPYNIKSLFELRST